VRFSVYGSFLIFSIFYANYVNGQLQEVDKEGKNI